MSEALCTITVTVGERKRLFRYERAVRLLREINVAVNKAQDWEGTRVGSVLEEIEDFLATEPKEGKVAG